MNEDLVNDLADLHEDSIDQDMDSASGTKMNIKRIAKARMLLARYSIWSKKHGAEGEHADWSVEPRQLIEWLERVHKLNCSREVFHRDCTALQHYCRVYGISEDVRKDIAGITRRKPNLETESIRVQRIASIDADKGLNASKLDQKALETFFNHLNSLGKDSGPKYKYGLLSSIFLRWVMMTGMRPIEFYGSGLIYDYVYAGDQYPLVVRVNGVGKGGDRGKSQDELYRHLNINDFSDSDIQQLRTLLDLVNDSREQYNYIYEAVRKTLKRVCQACFGVDNEITLYTGRHLYASEFRRSEHSDKYSLAAALGHTDIKNQRYYGDYLDKAEREFNFPLAFPVKHEIDGVKDAVTKRYLKTLERLKRFTDREEVEDFSPGNH